MDSIKLSSTPEPQSFTNNVKLAILKQAKGVGRDIVQILGFGKPASLKSLSSRLEKLNQDIDDLKMAAPSLSKRKTKQFLKKLKLRTELSDKLVARAKPENFSKNQSNDLGFIFRGKSEADIKAYFAQVNPEELQAFHNNLQKTAAFFVGDSTYFRTNLMQSWLGDKDFGLGEKILKAINERLANSDFLNSSNSKDEININSSVIFTEQNEIDWNEALTKKQISDDANPVTKMCLEIKQAVTNSAKLNRYNDTIDEVKINDQLTQDVKAAFTEQAEAHLNSGEIFITKQTNKDFDRADFCFSNNGKETVFKGGKKGGKGEKLAAQDAITEWVKHNTKGCTSEEQTKIKTLITAAVAIVAKPASQLL